MARRRQRRTRRPQNGGALVGRIFNPPPTPTTFFSSRPFTTWVEFPLSEITSAYKQFTTNSIADALTNQFGLRPSTADAESFSFSLLQGMFWLQPDNTSPAWGELTIQFINSPATGDGVLAQAKGYANATRAARIGYKYPHAVKQLPITEGANYIWIRVKREDSASGDQNVIARVQVLLRLYGMT